MMHPIHAPALQHIYPHRIRHGFFTRNGGVSQGIYHSLNLGMGSQDNPDHVMTNRDRVASFFNVPQSQLVTMNQTHSTHVFVLDETFNMIRPQADALVSKIPGLVLGVLTADCAPVLFLDGNNGVIGAAHAGWRGAFHGILENTITTMIAAGGQLSSIIAVVGPAISHKNYEVGQEFFQLFLDSESKNMVYFTAADKYGYYFFNLQSYIGDRLKQIGVEVSSLNLCTYEDKGRFYSYRRKTHLGQADYGRQISAIMLET